MGIKSQQLGQLTSVSATSLKSKYLDFSDVADLDLRRPKNTRGCYENCPGGGKTVVRSEDDPLKMLGEVMFAWYFSCSSARNEVIIDHMTLTCSSVRSRKMAHNILCRYFAV